MLKPVGGGLLEWETDDENMAYLSQQTLYSLAILGDIPQQLRALKFLSEFCPVSGIKS